MAAVNNDKLRLNNIKYLPYWELFLIWLCVAIHYINHITLCWMFIVGFNIRASFSESLHNLPVPLIQCTDRLVAEHVQQENCRDARRRENGEVLRLPKSNRRTLGTSIRAQWNKPNCYSHPRCAPVQYLNNMYSVYRYGQKNRLRTYEFTFLQINLRK